MTYVIANPHGSYTQFVRLLEVINFSKDDVMFVLGDIVDYGSEPMDLLCDLSFRENIWAISGEHDRLAYRMLKGFDDMLKNGGTPDADYIAEMTEWRNTAGCVTFVCRKSSSLPANIISVMRKPNISFAFSKYSFAMGLVS